MGRYGIVGPLDNMEYGVHLGVFQYTIEGLGVDGLDGYEYMDEMNSLIWEYEDEDDQDMVDRCLFTMISVMSQLGLKIRWKGIDE